MENFSNNPTTTINQTGGIGSSDTTITVTSATSFPSPNFRIIIDNEYILVTGVAGLVLTVTRGVEGSTAASHTNGSTVTHIVTALGLVQSITDRALSPTNNLSDLISVPTARTSLGLGTSATHPSTDFASTVTLTTPAVLYSTPITFTNTTGSFSGALSLINQAINTIFAGPSSGSSSAPTFRSLVAADIPTTLSGMTFTGTTKINVKYGDWTTDTAVSNTFTLDLSLTDKHTLTLGATNTIAISNMTNGQVLLLELVQDGTGSRTVGTWPTIAWSGGTAPTLTTTASKRDLITIVKRTDGTLTGAISIANY